MLSRCGYHTERGLGDSQGRGMNVLQSECPLGAVQNAHPGQAWSTQV